MGLYKIEFAKWANIIDTIVVYADSKEDAYNMTIEKDEENSEDISNYNGYVNMEYTVLEII